MIFITLNTINKYLPFIIKYIPTLLFVLTITISFLIGLHRGLRKSGFLLLNSIIAFVVVVILYFVLSNKEFFNEKVVEIINNIKGEYYLQNTLEVSHERVKFTDILIEYWLKNNDVNISDIIIDSGEYVTALAQAVLRVALACVLYVIYILITSILYVLYKIFFDTKRVRKKHNKRFEKFKEEHVYNMHRLSGGFIGAFRGFVGSLIFLSIIGAPLYLILSHDSVSDDVVENIEGYDEEKTLFNEIKQYGNSGIYKVLNSVKDPNDVPYYLFLTDVVFEGAITNSDGVNENIYFYTDLLKYRKFIDSSCNLIIEYVSDDFYTAINDNDQTKIMDCLTNTFKDQSFQEEFKLIFKSLDKNSYLFELSLSLINSIVANIDVLFEDNEELVDGLSVLFKEGYTSEYETIDDSNKVTIKFSDLIAVSDLDTILAGFFDFINGYYNTKLSDTEFYLDFVTRLSERLPSLSLFNNSKENVNKSLRRAYAYVCNRYLDSKDTNVSDTIFSEKYDNVVWTDEIKSLATVVPSAINIYNNKLKDVDFNSTDALDLMFSLTDDEVIDDYTICMNELTNSNVLEVLLNSSKVKTIIADNLNNNFKTFSCPDTIDVKSTLKILDHIISSKDNKELLNYMMDNKLSSETYETYKTALETVFDDYVIEECKNSNLVRAIFTSVLYDNASDYIYFDDGIFDVDSKGNTIYILDSDETYKILSNASNIFELLYPFINGSDDYSIIDTYITDGRIDTLLDSYVIEGSISNQFYNNDNISGNLVIPEGLRYTSISGSSSEIKLIVKAIKKLDLKIGELKSLTFNTIYNKIKNFTTSDTEEILESEVIYYNISNKITNESDDIIKGLIVPSRVKNTSNNLIKKDVLEEFLTNIILIYEENIETKEILKRMLKNNETLFKDSKAKDIFNATYAYMLSNDEDIKSELSAFLIPTSLQMLASKEMLTSNFTPSSAWYMEGYYINASIIDITNCANNDYEFEITEDILKNSLKDLVNESNTITGNTKIEVIYNSKVIKYNISKEILDTLKENESVSSEVLNSNLIASNDSDIGERIISYDDFSNLVYSINGLNIDLDTINTIENITLNNLNDTYMNNPISYYVFNCTITRAMISTNIDSILVDEGISKTNAALEYENGKYIDIYKKNELEFILNFNNKYGDITKDIIETISISEIVELLYADNNTVNSYLLHNQISSETIGIENIVIPYSDYNEEFSFIKPLSLKILLKTLEELGFTNLDDEMKIEKFTLSSSYEYFFKSNIVKASFPNLIDLTYNSSKIDIITSKYSSDYDYKKNDIYLMSDNELKLFVSELQKLGITNSNDTITKENIVSYATTYDITSSDIMHCFVSKLIAENPTIKTAIIMYGFNASSQEKNCANLTKNTLITQNLYYLTKKD